MKKGSAVIWLILAILWMGAIFLFSSQSFAESGGLSGSVASFLSGVLVPDFASWGPSMQAEWLDSINNLVRKAAHFLEFALLGVLVYMVLLNLSAGRRRGRPVTKLGLGMISFYICAVLSALDELHQSFSVGRTPSTGDMLIDCAGVVLGIIICAHKTRLPSSGAYRRDPPARRRG